MICKHLKHKRDYTMNNVGININCTYSMRVLCLRDLGVFCAVRLARRRRRPCWKCQCARTAESTQQLIDDCCGRETQIKLMACQPIDGCWGYLYVCFDRFTSTRSRVENLIFLTGCSSRWRAYHWFAFEFLSWLCRRSLYKLNGYW